MSSDQSLTVQTVSEVNPGKPASRYTTSIIVFVDMNGKAFCDEWMPKISQVIDECCKHKVSYGYRPITVTQPPTECVAMMVQSVTGKQHYHHRLEKGLVALSSALSFRFGTKSVISRLNADDFMTITGCLQYRYTGGRKNQEISELLDTNPDNLSKKQLKRIIEWQQGLLDDAETDTVSVLRENSDEYKQAEFFFKLMISRRRKYMQILNECANEHTAQVDASEWFDDAIFKLLPDSQLKTDFSQMFDFHDVEMIDWYEHQIVENYLNAKPGFDWITEKYPKLSILDEQDQETCRNAEIERRRFIKKQILEEAAAAGAESQKETTAKRTKLH